MKNEIMLAIDCEERTCGNCQYKTIFRTGLVGEIHSKCELFAGHHGQWGERDMKRSGESSERRIWPGAGE